MRIAVLGAGGAGGYFGGRWAQAGHAVTLIARGAHLDALRSSGLTIEGASGSERIALRAVGDVSELGPVDVVVVGTKSWQLEPAVEPLCGRIGESTVVLGLQNGVEAADTIARFVDRSQVLGGTCRVISYVAAPGVLRYVEIEPLLYIGELDGGSSDRVGRLQRALDLGSTLRVVGSEEIQAEVWRKFLFFAPVSGVGSVTQEPVGTFRDQSRTLLVAAMREVHSVAHAGGIDLGATAIDDALAFVDGLPAEGTSSMQRDFAAGCRTELEALAGAVVRLGESRGIATPAHRQIYDTLLPLERRALEVR